MDISNVTNKTSCELNPDNKWVNTVYNYDNIFNALFTLFIIATLDGWVNSMYNGIDAVGVNMQPIKNNNEYMAFFVLIYLIMVGFFVVNMFVGVIIDNFHKCCEAQAESEAIINAEKKFKIREKLLLGNAFLLKRFFLFKFLLDYFIHHRIINLFLICINKNKNITTDDEKKTVK